jgi:hypothetical protein
MYKLEVIGGISGLSKRPHNIKYKRGVSERLITPTTDTICKYF